MSFPPRLLKPGSEDPETMVQAEEIPGAGIKYRAEGELVPALHCLLDGTLGVYFEHHVLFWKDPDIQIGFHSMSKGFKRMIAGLPVLLIEASGKGQVAFSRDAPGQVFGLTLKPGQSIIVREHQWLAATAQLTFTPHRQRGIVNLLFGGNSFWTDYFENPKSSPADGVVWLHGFGNVFEKQLDEGEEIDVVPGGWIYRDPSVKMTERPFGLRTGFLASNDQVILNRLTGPGKVGLQTMYAGTPVSAKGKGNAAPSLTQGTDAGE